MNLRVIISPAKKMNADTDSLPWRDYPLFLSKTDILLKQLRSMSNADLQKLWNCNDRIAALNIERVRDMNLRQRLTPAVLAYEGIQYQYMAPNAFTKSEFEYLQDRLRILSGFYGVLRPFDGVVPYRLEMQAKLSIGPHRDLYSFWESSIADSITEGADCLINLASKEYSIAATNHLPKSFPVVNVIFAEEKNGKLVEKATMCKMARGEMVRFMAENQISIPDDLRAFDRLDFRYQADQSNSQKLVFTRIPKKKPQ